MFACANKIGRNFNNSISFYWSPSNWREGGISRYFYRRWNCLSSSWFSINLASKDNNILNEVNLATLLPNTAWKVSVSLRSEYGEIPSVIPYSIWMREIPTRKNSALRHSPRSILPLHRVLPNTIKSYAVSQREVFTKNVSCKIFVLSAHFRNIFIIKCQLFSPQIFPLPSHITMCFYTPWKMHHYLKPNQNKNKA